MWTLWHNEHEIGLVHEDWIDFILDIGIQQHPEEMFFRFQGAELFITALTRSYEI